MSIRSNMPEGYHPFGTTDPHVFDGNGPDAAPIELGGLYYRRDAKYSYDELSSTLLQCSEEANFLSYQYWAEFAWKTQQGTYNSAERFIDKLTEEHLEFKLAVDQFRQCTEKDDKPALAKEVVLEAGDVMWCITALSSNAQSDIDAGMRNILFAYTRGTQHIRNLVAEKPRWRDVVGSMAVKYDQLNFGDLDQIIAAGFEPQPSPLMNIFDSDEEQFDVPQHLFMEAGLIAVIASLHRRQYGYGDDLSKNPTSFVMPGEFQRLALQIAEVASSCLLETLYVANKLLPGISMATIVNKNVEKISSRVITNTVDKTDGER